ncbi:MAG: NADH-quinone oxidoreductase subunit C [Thaumarchaeota archaeon]|nr:NADH-quinone oxidoreductase subunit C [Nitrososphaerota archaeon]MCL5317004.1 NADH-quinone oxidoreductase subunit C [Nitrososphaerota archaeon]
MTETPKVEPKLPEREKTIADDIAAKFGGDLVSIDIKPKRIKMKVKASRIMDAASYLNDSLGFDHVVSVSGVDYPKDNEIEVVYHAATYGNAELSNLVIALSARLPRDNPKTPSLIAIWPSVEYSERETFEMVGVVFEGHPKMERLILPEDWHEIPPLRKDYRNPGR